MPWIVSFTDIDMAIPTEFTGIQTLFIYKLRDSKNNMEAEIHLFDFSKAKAEAKAN